MARDERRRQKALARKKAKKKARQRANQARTGSFQSVTDGVSKSAIRSAPIHECLCWEFIADAGIGHVVVTRRIPTGEFVIGMFLVDTFCLGVKDSLIRVFSTLHEYDEFKQLLSEDVPVRIVSAPYARKLVEGAVTYARDLGFEPHRSYQATAEIFGDINPAECPDVIVYGKDGKPFYMRGPGENAIHADQIVKRLTLRCGPGGFNFVTTPPPGDDDGDEDDDLDWDEDDIFDDDVSDTDGKPYRDGEIIAEEVLDTEPSEPVPGPAPAPAPQEKPKGFFGRLFRK